LEGVGRRRRDRRLQGVGGDPQVRPRRRQAQSGERLGDRPMVQDVLVPDIGDFKDVPVIDILVKPGDKVDVDAPLVTLESDKATMDVPAPSAGVVREIKVKVGDKVSQGNAVISLETEGAGKAAKPASPQKPAPPETP